MESCVRTASMNIYIFLNGKHSFDQMFESIVCASLLDKLTFGGDTNIYPVDTIQRVEAESFSPKKYSHI